VTRTCLFTRESGPVVEDIPSDALGPSLERDGLEYRRYRVLRLGASREIDTAVVYCAARPDPDDEVAIYHAIFRDRGGVFAVEPDA
jgi:hypothetical protein